MVKRINPFHAFDFLMFSEGKERDRGIKWISNVLEIGIVYPTAGAKWILSHFKKFIANDKYFRHKKENLPLPLQMQYLKSRINFAAVLLHFWNLN